MSIYIINIIFLLVGYAFWKNIKIVSDFRRAFCIQATVQWVILSGLRSSYVGADTGRYQVMFEQAQNTTWTEIFANFKTFISGSSDLKDYGYMVFQKVIQLFVSDYQIYLLIIAVMIIIPMSIWIYKQSSDILLSYILFSCLFYSFFAITGIRQSIVTAIGVFIGECLLKQKKYLRYIVMVIVLALVHKSAIVLLIYFFVHKKKITTNYVVGLSLTVIVCWFFKSTLMLLLSSLIGYENYAEQANGAGAYTFTVLYMAVFILMIIVRHKLLILHPDSNIHFNAIVIGAFLLPLVSINQSAMRAVQYFSVYLMLLLPELIDAVIVRKQRTIANFLCLAMLIVLLIGNNPYYTFYWQV